MSDSTAERHVLVLAGGRGERLWPWSRPERPKQLLPLAGGGRTLLAATLERALALAAPERIVVLTARDLVAATRRECPAGVRVLGEPVARNTAAAIGAIAHLVGDRPLAVMPADHLIEDRAAFRADLERAFTVAERDAVLLTFGIPPTGPETNLGYIQRGARLAEGLYRVARFHEKPERARAEEYLRSGEYRWNSGIFVWRAGVFLKALEATRPEIARGLAALRGVSADGFEPALERVFPDLPSISVDHAVLEHAPNVLMVEASFDWDDLGSWSAWARRQPHDPRGNVVVGNVVPIECDECVLVGEGQATTAALGLRRMIVVHSGGDTLVCPLDRSDRVRQVSEAARARGRGDRR
jgi:mannose-1-phosphate guanylyltransferase